MKTLTNYFNNKNILFKQIEDIEPKLLGSRKKLQIFSATTLNNHYYAIFVLHAKSRFLRKQATELSALYGALVSHKDHNFKKRILLISSPLCSKAKAQLEQEGWSVEVIDESSYKEI